MSMFTAAVVVGGAAVVGSVISSDASRKASNTQADAAREATSLNQESADRQLDLQQRMYEEGVKRQQPWMDAGRAALSQMRAGEYRLPSPFQGEMDFNFQLEDDPGYSFRLSEGLKALDRQAAARGGLMSGNALRAAGKYGQEMASQEYGNAYARAYQKSRDQYQKSLDKWNSDLNLSTTGYNRLASLAGVGQTTAQQINSAGQQYASNSGQIASNSANQIGDLIQSGAAARASGYVGQANAFNNAIGQGTGFYQNYQLMKTLKGR